MVTVAMMHEQMHQRAKKQRQKDDCAKQMSAVLHPEIDARDCHEAHQNESGW